MRILQTYDPVIVKTKFQGFLLFDFFNLSLKDTNLVKKNFQDCGFFMYPLSVQILTRLCSSELISFFKSILSIRLKMFYLLIPMSEKNLFTLDFIKNLEGFFQKKLCFAQFFFLYNNFLLHEDRKKLLAKTAKDITLFYKNFYLNLFNNFLRLMVFNAFFFKVICLLTCFKLMLNKLNFIL
jgi:hypothetical protein